MATPEDENAWGPYKLIEPIGRGSLGVVWRGFDPAIAREIAVKLYTTPDLPPEPRLMARVRHANVVTVFGAAVHEGRPGIWMELVRGRTLAERVRSEGRLPVTEVVRIGIELCDALEAIHDAQLLHQDLSARNVMERDGGGVVLMDLGDRADDTSSYVAPEVVLGQTASAQSDVYSLGALLYHLLTGDHPAPALKPDEPRPRHERTLRQARPEISRRLARCVSRALEEPQRRYADAVALRKALERTRARASWTRPRWTAEPGPLVSISIAALLGLGAGFLIVRSRPAMSRVSLTRLTTDAGLTTDPVRSPDGTLLAYASDRGGGENLDIWVQRLPDGSPVRLTTDPSDDSQPSVSPDGGHIAFRSERDGGGTYLVPTSGGEARLFVQGGRQPRFSPDGQHIAYISGKELGGLMVAAVTGGTSNRPVVEGGSSGAVWSSDGKHVLFAAARHDGVDWWVASMAERRAVRTGAFDVLSRHGIEVLTSWPTPSDWRGNRVLFHARHGDATNIWDVELSPSFRLAGAPRRLTLATEDQRNPSLGPDDSLLFSSRADTPYLWELRLDTDRGDASSAEPRPLMLVPHHLGRGIHELSADGRWMAYASVLPRSAGIAVKDLDRGLETVLTTPSQGIDERYPVISRDGSKVVYSVVENGRDAVRRVTVKGGLPETLCQDCGYPTGCSPDERYVLLQYGVPERASLGVLDTVSGRRSEILRHPTRELYRANFSPDGRWMAFHASLISGLTQEFIAPFRDLRAVPESEWVPITDGSSWTDAPAWSPSGNLLYYVSDADGFRCIWAQPLDPRTRKPSANAFVVHHAHSRKRSIGNVNIWGVELSVARGRLVFNMGEARGNIWLARYRE